MELGIFAKTFPRPTLEQTLDAVAAHGLTHDSIQHVLHGPGDAAGQARRGLVRVDRPDAARARAHDGGDLGHVQHG